MGRPVTVTVGPLATAAVNKVSLTQKAARAGTNQLVLNGAAGSFVANSVCASQTPGGAGALVINGTLASSLPTGVAIAYLPGNLQGGNRIYITGGSDESGKTFTVLGYVFGPNGGPSAVTEVITGPNASTVSSLNTYLQIISITVSAGTTGAITVGHYSTATLDVARQILFTSAGNDSANTITITGTDVSGTVISESLLGGSGATTVVSALSYKTVTSITASAAVASTIQVGTNTVASSQFIRLDDYASNAQVAIQVNVTGTVNYTVQSTMDDPNDFTRGITPSQMVWVNSSDTNVVNATTTQQSQFGVAPIFARVVLNSGTGSITATMRQVVER